jgi:hypothetical protein
MPQIITESLQSTLMVESVSDNPAVLSKARGEFFVIDKSTRNGRFYSRRLWERAIKSVQEKLDQGGLIGTIGHDNPIDESAVLNGKISHIVTKLWIGEDSIGYGEVSILNTPSGQTLNNLLRAGVKIPVSSRGYGEYKGLAEDGSQFIDPETFILETFDFVLKPGVETAYPELVEKLINLQKEDDTMEQQIVERLTEEKVLLQQKLTEVLEENQKLQEKKQNESIQQWSSRLNKQKKLTEELKSKYTKIISALRRQNSELNEGLRKYLELGPLKELAKQTDLLKQYGMLGNPKQIKRLMGISESFMKLGDPEQLAKEKALLRTYKRLGTPQEIS